MSSAPLHAPQIVDIIITRHHDTGKPKGCFVEFASQEHLAQALTADGEPMLRRPVRIQVRAQGGGAAAAGAGLDEGAGDGSGRGRARRRCGRGWSVCVVWW